MTILAWFIVAFFTWIFSNIAVYGLLDWRGRRAMRRKAKRAAEPPKEIANGQC